MPQFYSEGLRGPIAYHNNNWKPTASLDPAITTIGDLNGAFTVDAGVTATSDGDILSLSGTTGTNGVSHAGLSVNTTSFPNFVLRAKGSGTIDVLLTFSSGSQTLTFTLSSTYSTQSQTMTSGKTLNSVKYLNQSVAGTNSLDYEYHCAKTPVQLSQTDLVFGTVSRLSLLAGIDHAEIRLNNRTGLYKPGGTKALGFGDHLHVYLGQAATLFHVYGGYVEKIRAINPPDEIEVQSRGYGLALGQTRLNAIFSNSSPNTIVGTAIDGTINSGTRNGVSTDSGGNAFTGYQITRSFSNFSSNSFPLYVINMNDGYSTLREIGDLAVQLLSPAGFYVDPAENLQAVNLPGPVYPTTLSYGKNIAMYDLGRDVTSLRNRIHYFGIAQIPGNVDGITEYSTDGAFQGAWDVERLNTDTVVDLHTVTSPVAIGGHSNQFHFHSGGGSGGNKYLGAMIYPKTHSSTWVDFTKLGSQWTPPVMELYFRVHPNAPATFGMGQPSTLFFANDASNRYEYFLPGDGVSSVLNVGTFVNDNWYHLLVPVGPNAGNLFLSAPTPNFVPQPTLLTPQYLNKVGSPDWSTIKYFGLYNGNTDANDSNASTLDIYIDGARLLGSRYRLAMDNRTVAGGRYPDIREAFYYDPISKDETALQYFAAAELKRLWNGILRGTITCPLLADVLPEQQVTVTIASAGYSATNLRVTGITHRFSPNGYLTELSLTDDFTNSQTLDQFKLTNVLAEMGENAIFSRQLVDLKSTILDPTFTAIIDKYTS